MAYHGIGGGAGGQRSSKEERFVQFSFWPKSLSLMLNPLSTGAAADYIARFTVSCLQRAHLPVPPSVCLLVSLSAWVSQSARPSPSASGGGGGGQKRMHYKGHQVGILSFVCNKEKRIQSRRKINASLLDCATVDGSRSRSGRDARARSLQVRASAKKLNYMQASGSSFSSLLPCSAPHLLPLPVPLQVHLLLLRLRPSRRIPQVTAGAKLLWLRVGACGRRRGRGCCRYDKAAA